MADTIARSVQFTVSASFVEDGKTLAAPYSISSKETIPSNNSALSFEDLIRDVPPTGTAVPAGSDKPASYSFNLVGADKVLAFEIEDVSTVALLAIVPRGVPGTPGVLAYQVSKLTTGSFSVAMLDGATPPAPIPPDKVQSDLLTKAVNPTNVAISPADPFMGNTLFLLPAGGHVFAGSAVRAFLKALPDKGTPPDSTRTIYIYNVSPFAASVDIIIGRVPSPTPPSTGAAKNPESSPGKAT
jgi:hypothetical protein